MFAMILFYLISAYSVVGAVMAFLEGYYEFLWIDMKTYIFSFFVALGMAEIARTLRAIRNRLEAPGG